MLSARQLVSLLSIFTICLVAACSSPDNAGKGKPAPILPDMPDSSLRILVIGGTNGIGLKTVELALQRGHDVTALARRPERMPLQDKRLTVVGGDILNTADMQTAIAGQHAVVIAIGMGPTRSEVSLFSKGTINVLQAMRETGVGRLIAVTGIGAGESRGHGGYFYDSLLFPLALRTIYEDKDRMEAIISGTAAVDSIAWTIVRPGFLTDEAPTGQYRVIEDLTGVTAGQITRGDVAHFILAALESGQFHGESPLITE